VGNLHDGLLFGVSQSGESGYGRIVVLIAKMPWIALSLLALSYLSNHNRSISRCLDVVIITGFLE